MKRKIQQRIKELEKWFRDDKWIDPFDNRTTNGYNRALREELTFLKSLIS